MQSDERDSDLLDLMLELIGLVTGRISVISYTAFEQSRDEIDLTAYRLGRIGEAARKLSPDLKGRHPEIRWRQMYGMRNILAHEYPAVRSELLWRVATEDLQLLEAVCRAELERLDK
jgi:uncharacterized protein with HEPN domain